MIVQLFAHLIFPVRFNLSHRPRFLDDSAPALPKARQRTKVALVDRKLRNRTATDSHSFVANGICLQYDDT